MKHFIITYVGANGKVYNMPLAAESSEMAEALFAPTGCDIIMVTEVDDCDDEDAGVSGK